MPSLHITPSGGLLTHQFIEAIQQTSFNHPAAAPETFALPGKGSPSPVELERSIAKAWELLVERWDSLEPELPGMDISTLRERWIRPLFQLLEFDLEYQRADLVLEDDLRFPISYMANPFRVGDVRVPVHTVLPNAAGLDMKRDGGGAGIKRLAPHDLLQRYLNLAPNVTWGMLTDGVRLRLLRDYHHTYTRGFVEFDLQGIFSERDLAAFRGMYRLCHASRFMGMAAPLDKKKKSKPAADEDEQAEEEEAPQQLTPLELFYQHALSTGIKVGEDLRENVRTAIEALTNGFVQATAGLMDWASADQSHVASLYDDVLHTIYRVLFLLFAEQRGMLPGRGSLYMDEYSLTALRARAERPISEDPHLDLWEKLKVTFSMVEHGAPDLRIYAYNGALFSAARTPILTPTAAEVDKQPSIRNDAILKAIHALTTITREKVLQRISYADLSVEEMGSVYESLLDYTPRIARVEETVDGRTIKPGHFYLDPRGKARKTTGSYYTHPTLVNELISSALLPVLYERLAEAVPGYDPERPDLLKPDQHEAAEAALLDLKVVDPAAGSGAFLIAADNTMGLNLARIRSGEYYPTEREVRRAKRDVLARCIYAVDLNPMAVELCKVSLWINAAVEDAPLNFLDHHIKTGNSLVGIGPNLPVKLQGERILDLTSLEIHEDAFNPLSMDEAPIARAVKKRHQEEMRQRKYNVRQPGIFAVTTVYGPDDVHYGDITGLSLADPNAAERQYHAWSEDNFYQRSRFAADVWTAAHFWIHTSEMARRCAAPTEAVFRLACKEGPESLPAAFAQEVQRLRQEHSFFHWQLEFPEVFAEGKRGGFDVVLGNPPWERIKLQEQEFFGSFDESIANAPNAAARKKLIAAMQKNKPELWGKYLVALRSAEAMSRFLRTSKRFPLGASGDINTYQVFAEHDRDLVSSGGYAGYIVPTGIATDFSNKDFFANLVETNRLVSLYDFENRRAIFPGVHRSFKFSLVTIRGIDHRVSRSTADFAFFLLSVDDLSDPEKHFSLSAADFDLLNPNTRTCPIFRSRTDAELTKKIYKAAPILIREIKDGENVTTVSSWDCQITRTFDMARFGSMARTNKQLCDQKFSLLGNGRFINDKEQEWIPIIESKTIWGYDHRFATYSGVDNNEALKGNCVQVKQNEKEDPTLVTQARFWLENSIVKEYTNWHTRNYWLAYRNITNTTNERTMVSTIIPRHCTDYTVRLIFGGKVNGINAILFLGNLNSYTFDYISRQSVAGTNFSDYIMKQLPVLPPNYYLEETLRNILPKCLELIFTSWDLHSIVDEVWMESNSLVRNDLTYQTEQNNAATFGGHINSKRPGWLDSQAAGGFPYPPFKWDEDRRAQLRVDLDGLFAHLYGIHRDEFAYILDTFPIVRRKEEAKYGEYRTKRLCLEAYDRIAASPEYADLVPLEARERSQSSVLGEGNKVTPPQPAPRATVPAQEPQPAAAKTPAQPNSKPRPVSKPDLKPEVRLVPESPVAPSDYGLYKCLGCGKMVVGYDKENHIREKHRGQDPGWKKLGG